MHRILLIRPSKISFNTWTSIASNFKKGKSKIRIISQYWSVINGWKRNKGGICHAINKYAKANNKHTKDYDKNKESSYFKYWDVNKLYGWEKLQKLPVNEFKSVEDISKFDERLRKSWNEQSY